MAAPLIVGEARVVRSSSKAQLSTETAPARSELRRRISTQRQRREQEETPLDEGQEQQRGQNVERPQRTRLLNRLNKKLSQMPSNVRSDVAKMRATSAAIMIFWSVIGFYIPQITFWFIGIGFIGTKFTPIVGQWIPGETVFAVFWFLIICLGVSTMLYAIAIFTLRRVDYFGGMKGIIFILCLAGYFVPFLNLFPFFIIWIFSVSLLQKKAE